MELEYLKEVWKKAGEDNVMSVAGKQRLLPLPGAPSQSLFMNYLSFLYA